MHVREVGARFAFGIVFCTIVRCIGVTLFLATRRTPDTNPRQDNHHALHRQIRSSRRGHSAKRSPRQAGNTVPGEEVEETLLK